MCIKKFILVCALTLSLPSRANVLPTLAPYFSQTPLLVAVIGVPWMIHIIVNKIGLKTSGQVFLISSIPEGNQNLAAIAIKKDKPTVLMTALSISALLQKIPYLNSVSFIHDKFELHISNEVLHEIIKKGQKDLAYVLIHYANFTGIEIDEVHEGFRPLALALMQDISDETALDLIEHKAFLDVKGSSSQTQNLFHDLIASGKKELIEAVLKRDDAQYLMETVDKDGNTVSHLSTVSPSLRNLFSPHHLNSHNFHANKAGHFPTDMIVASYFTDASKVSAEDLIAYFQSAPDSIFANHPQNLFFKRALEDSNLSQIPKLLLEKHAIDPNLPDANGHVPLKYALENGEDELASRLLEQTDCVFIENADFALALSKQMKVASQIAQKLGVEKDELAKRSLFLNPIGDGKSLLVYMIENFQSFHADIFKTAYRDLKLIRLNPFEELSSLGVNLLHSAILFKNKDAVECILSLMKEEQNGLLEHISVLMGGRGMIFPAMLYHEFGPLLAQTLKEDAFGQNLLTMMLQSSSLYIAAEDNMDIDSTALTLAKEKGALMRYEDSKSYLVVIPEYVKQEQERLTRIQDLQNYEKKKVEGKDQHLKQTYSDSDQSILPHEIVLKPIYRHPKQDKTLAREKLEEGLEWILEFLP